MYFRIPDVRSFIVSYMRAFSSKRVFHFVSVFLVFFLSIAYLSAQGYEIKVKVSNLPEASIILGHHFATNLLPDDTIKLDKKGEGVFKGKDKLKEGMYFLYFPSRVILDFLVGSDQIFTIQTDTTDLQGKTVVTGSTDNEVFFAYQKFIAEKRRQQQQLQEEFRTASDSASKNRITQKLKEIDNEVITEINKILTNFKGYFVADFVKATRDVEVPDYPRDAQGNVLDSAFKYKYYKAHYFDNMDFTDARLLRTPIYDEKFKFYFQKVLLQVPDSLIKELDPLIEKARKDPEVFRYVLVTLFNHYAQSQIMGHDGVFIHIAEKYYIPEATWANTDFITKLKEQINKRKPLLIGQTAPDFQLVLIPDDHFRQAATDTTAAANVYVGSFFRLMNVKAKYTILMFWECDCGHCQKAMPELHQVFNRLKDKGVQVVAVHMLGGVEGKKKWIKWVNEHELYGWINAWNPYDYKYKELYDIKSTPILYLLDENKKIVAKLITPEAAEEIINALLKENSKKPLT